MKNGNAFPRRNVDSLNPPKVINSVRRSFEILEAFTPEEPRLTLQDLTVKLGLPKTNISPAIRKKNTFLAQNLYPWA
jgi:hypothetical protein